MFHIDRDSFPGMRRPFGSAKDPLSLICSFLVLSGLTCLLETGS